MLKNSIKIYAPDGSDITRQCTITAGENKYVIETGKNLSYDESIKVSYQVKLKEASLSGKTLKNTAKSRFCQTSQCSTFSEDQKRIEINSDNGK